MTIHAPHPDTHTHGLADNCPRCAEHAEDLLKSLDTENLRSLVRRLNNDWQPRSDNEARAMRVLETHHRHEMSAVVRKQTKAARVYRCAMCGRRLKRWVYSRHTKARYCHPGEGCSK